ncbi:hypothetical protein [Nocardia blacklockiae]|uniref:hypothetical protein n=1 Tax=Nocardia blacklockiae TaxID=480036 RepID=UPI001893F317|nr:hypothetical protein [Nocardia blacklockiae]MBF6175801.1 hypothetical protein [Nocardia blacklockiae]
MQSFAVRIAGAVAAAALAPVLMATTAQADQGTIYFAAGSTNCSIDSNGTVGCDFAVPQRLSYRISDNVYTPAIPVTQVVIDIGWLPAHPGFGGTHTLPGGNPPLSQVATGQGTWGSYIDYAGAHCESGFHGSFTCSSKGHSWSDWSGNLTASL